MLAVGFISTGETPDTTDSPEQILVALAGFASSQFALISAADENNLSVLQTLNYLDNNNFPPAIIGLTVVYLGMAWHILSARSLPVWLGWVSLVIGILGLAGPIGFVAFLLFIPYAFILGILVYQRSPTAAAAVH